MSLLLGALLAGALALAPPLTSAPAPSDSLVVRAAAAAPLPLAEGVAPPAAAPQAQPDAIRFDVLLQPRFTRRFLRAEDAIADAGDADSDARGLSGNVNTIKVRQARLGARAEVGRVGAFRLQVDAGSQSGSPRDVSVKQAYVTLRDLPEVLPEVGWRLHFGLQPLPFGFHLQQSPAARYVPERYIGFSGDGSGLFRRQDYDMGIALDATLGAMGSLHVGVFAGPGETFVERNPDKDLVGRLGIEPLADVTLGVSGYLGTGPIETENGSGDRQRSRNLLGLDARYDPETGFGFAAEYLRGRGGQVGARALPSVYNADALRPFVDDAPVEAYFVQATYAPTPALRFVAAYDFFNRNTDATSFSLDGVAFGARDLAEERAHLGALYHLDDAVRFRLWLEQPLSYPSRPGADSPLRKAALFTAEVQFSF